MKILIAAAFLTAAAQSPERVIECAEAVQAHNDSATRITSALQNYAGCLDAARINDNCAAEFGKLEEAQRAYEQSMATVRARCPEDQLQPGSPGA